MDAARRQIDRVVEFFSGPDGRERYERLVFFAQTEIQRHRWCSGWRASPPGGNGAADFVNDLLRQVLLGCGASDRRRIPPDVEVEVALRWHVRSKISAAVRSYENRNFIRYWDFDGGERLVENALTACTDDTPGTLSDDTAAIMKSGRCQRFLDFVADDTLVHSMLMLIRDLGIDGPADRVAKYLDVCVRDVYVARRRLKAATRRFLQNGHHE